MTETIQINHSSPSVCANKSAYEFTVHADLQLQEVESRRSCWGPLPLAASLCVSVPLAVPVVQSTSHTAGKKVIGYLEQSDQLDP